MYRLIETEKKIEGQCVYCYAVGKIYIYEDEKKRKLEVCSGCKGIAEGKEGKK